MIGFSGRAGRGLAVMCAVTLLAAVSARAELFFSEYIEGTSNNKSVEIYNPDCATVDLAAGLYTLELYSNGAAVPTATLSLMGSVATGGVHVVANSSSHADILAQADQLSSSVCNFNGDDAVALRKNGVLIDVIGQIGFDPGTEWVGGGVSTLNRTIRRKSTICAGDTDGSNAFDPSIEWDGFAVDTFTDLGMHSAPSTCPMCGNTGSCCHGAPNYLCDDDVLEGDCMGGSDTWTNGVDCIDLSPPCAEPTGACCHGAPLWMCDDGVLAGACMGANDVWSEAMLCVDACIAPLGACCDTVALTCTNFETEANCLEPNDEWTEATACVDLDPPCAPPGACCKAGTCSDVFGVGLCDLAGGVYQGDGSACDDPVVCPATPFVIINELDADTPGTDTAEFVELYDGGAGNTDLNGLVLVFYNGSDDASLSAVDLTGSTDVNGYYVVGNALVPGVDQVIADGAIQNGADAAALYVGNGVNFPSGTLVTTTDLIDAVVHGTADPDDAGLLVLLNVGQPQVDESGGGNSAGHSVQRCPNGSGGQRNTNTYVARTPTPDADNNCPLPGSCCLAGECLDASIQEECENAGGVYQGNDTLCAPDGTVTCPAPPSVIISEIMYNPLSAEGGTPDFIQLVEWVEIYNNGGVAVDIGGWFLRDNDPGPTGGIPLATMLAPGEAAVLVPGPDTGGMNPSPGITPADFQAAWGMGFNIYPLSDWSDGLQSLSNGGNEQLSLRDAGGLTVDIADYAVASPWPAISGAGGPSIYLLCNSLDATANDIGANWQRSDANGAEGAYTNTMTVIFNGLDTGSPGVVFDTCTEVGACCVPGLGTCSNLDIDTCEPDIGNFQGDGTRCETLMPPCPVAGACCNAGVCTPGQDPDMCTGGGGTYLGDGSTCDGTPCNRGACCYPGGCADDVNDVFCVADGGVYQGNLSTCAGSGGACTTPAPDVALNESRIEQIGADNDEFIELAGAAATSLDGLTILAIGDGDPLDGSGIIELAIPLTGQSIPVDGFWCVSESTMTIAVCDLVMPANFVNLEASDNITLLLVSGFSGMLGADLDTNNDCVLDSTPWVAELDRIAVIEEENPPVGTECHYGPPTIGPEAGPLLPGLVYRCPDATGAWEIGTFDPIGTDDTPGDANFCGGPPCVIKQDCADTTPADNVRDNNCVKWTCDAGACTSVDIPFGDIGSPAATLTVADCLPDFSPDGSDGFHALNCFQNSFFGVPATPYLCDNFLIPMNADVGGAGLDCCPDGACDGNDRFLALTAFSAGGGPAGPNNCACPIQGFPQHICPPPATAPTFEPTFVGSTGLTMATAQRTAKAGDLVSVDVFIDNAVDLQGYQLHLGATGGRSGSLELVDVSISDRADHVYAGLPFWDAYNVDTHQMLAGMDSGAIATKSKGYLATFTYRVSADASGTFVVDVLAHATGKKDNRSFLWGPVNEGMVQITGSRPAVIVVSSSRASGLR